MLQQHAVLVGAGLATDRGEGHQVVRPRAPGEHALGGGHLEVAVEGGHPGQSSGLLAGVRAVLEALHELGGGVGLGVVARDPQDRDR